MPDALVVKQPAAANRLFLLFHGVGADAAGLVPLGRSLAAAFPDAAIASVPAAFAFDGAASGRQWFSVRGVTEENRAQRVDEAMPHFLAAVRREQERSGIGPEATTLVGFSQGAILSLESARAGAGAAARIVSLAGRFAQLPATPPACRIHFLHGALDPVIPVQHAVEAARRLQALGAPATLDVLLRTAHGVTPEMESALLERLRES